MELATTPSVKPKFISPKRILEDLKLVGGERVVDYGSGAGHWTIAAAELVGPTGCVYALDDDSDMLGLVLNQAQTRGLANIETEEIVISKGLSKKTKEADLVILSNVLHLISEKQELINNLEKLVSDSGRVVVIDWLPQDTLIGPPLRLRVNEQMAIEIFEKAGLKFACTVDTGWQHFGLVFDRVGDGCVWKER